MGVKLKLRSKIAQVLASPYCGAENTVRGSGPREFSITKQVANEYGCKLSGKILGKDRRKIFINLYNCGVQTCRRLSVASLKRTLSASEGVKCLSAKVYTLVCSKGKGKHEPLCKGRELSEVPVKPRKKLVRPQIMTTQLKR